MSDRLEGFGPDGNDYCIFGDSRKGYRILCGPNKRTIIWLPSTYKSTPASISHEVVCDRIRDNLAKRAEGYSASDNSRLLTTRADKLTLAEGSAITAALTESRESFSPEVYSVRQEDAEADAACNRDHAAERKRRVENAEARQQEQAESHSLQEENARLQRELEAKDEIEAARTRELLELLLQKTAGDIDDQIEIVGVILSELEEIHALNSPLGGSRSISARRRGFDMTKKEWALYNTRLILQRRADNTRIPALEARAVTLQAAVDEKILLIRNLRDQVSKLKIKVNFMFYKDACCKIKR